MDIFNEGGDLDFLIDYSSLVTRRRFTDENSEPVRTVLDAYSVEGAWQSAHPDESERLAQRKIINSPIRVADCRVKV